MKFSIKDFFSKCDQIRSKLRIWTHFMKKSLMENFIFFVQCKRQFPLMRFDQISDQKHDIHLYGKLSTKHSHKKREA